MKKKNEIKVIRYWNSDHTKYRKITVDPGAAKRMRHSVLIDKIASAVILLVMLGAFVGLLELVNFILWGTVL